MRLQTHRGSWTLCYLSGFDCTLKTKHKEHIVQRFKHKRCLEISGVQVCKSFPSWSPDYIRHVNWLLRFHSWAADMTTDNVQRKK